MIQRFTLVTSNHEFIIADVPIENVRLRFALLQSLNNMLETVFLPLVDLRPATIFAQSSAGLLSKCRKLMFYDNKVGMCLCNCCILKANHLKCITKSNEFVTNRLLKKARHYLSLFHVKTVLLHLHDWFSLYCC